MLLQVDGPASSGTNSGSTCCLSTFESFSRAITVSGSSSYEGSWISSVTSGSVSVSSPTIGGRMSCSFSWGPWTISVTVSSGTSSTTSIGTLFRVTRWIPSASASARERTITCGSPFSLCTMSMILSEVEILISKLFE